MPRWREYRKITVPAPALALARARWPSNRLQRWNAGFLEPNALIRQRISVVNDAMRMDVKTGQASALPLTETALYTGPIPTNMCLPDTLMLRLRSDEQVEVWVDGTFRYLLPTVKAAFSRARKLQNDRNRYHSRGAATAKTGLPRERSYMKRVQLTRVNSGYTVDMYIDGVDEGRFPTRSAAYQYLREIGFTRGTYDPRGCHMSPNGKIRVRYPMP
jgi:hypothetical protein